MEFNKEKGYLAVFDKSGKLRLVYSSPLVRLPSNKTTVPQLEWDAASSSIQIALPDLAPSYPLVIAFGLNAKLPEPGRDWFNFSFPSIRLPKFGVELSDSESESDDEGKKKHKLGLKMPKFGGSAEGDKDAKFKVNFSLCICYVNTI